MRLIIDTDTAGDDCVSLLIALRSPNIGLEAITINCGNIAFPQQVENALYTVQVAGRSGQVPVYPGCDRPLLHPHTTVEDIHGPDGMGGSFFPLATQRPEREHAVDALIRLVSASPGEITILAQAPLTNLALAARRDPSFAAKVKHLWLMGGTNNALGNVTPAAEYNIWVDPEAAKIVFEAGFPITMVGWEICVRHSVVGGEAMAAIEALDTPLSRFYLAVTRTARAFSIAQQGLDGIHPPRFDRGRHAGGRGDPGRERQLLRRRGDPRRAYPRRHHRGSAGRARQARQHPRLPRRRWRPLPRPPHQRPRRLDHSPLHCHTLVPGRIASTMIVN